MATSLVKIESLAIQGGTTRSVIARWEWADSDNTDHYEIQWNYIRREYSLVTGTYKETTYTGSRGTTTKLEDVFTASSADEGVQFWIRPIAKTHTVDGKEEPLFSYSNNGTYSNVLYFKDSLPEKLDAPTVTLEKKQLSASYKNLLSSDDAIYIDKVEFQVIKDNNESKPYKQSKCSITASDASFTWTVEEGSVYKVRARAINGSIVGTWSDYSSTVETNPNVPTITKVDVRSKNLINITWTSSESAETYKFELAPDTKDHTPEELFLDPGIQKTTHEYKKSDLTVIDGHITAPMTVQSGALYYMRACSMSSKSSDNDDVEWSNIVSFIIGTPSTSPTTWSSTTTAVVGGPLKLNWIHNSEDESKISNSKLYLYVNDVLLNDEPYIITKEAYYDPENIISAEKFDDEKESVRIVSINTTAFKEGSKIKWEVQTAGVDENVYGEMSVVREVDIYATPVVSAAVLDKNGNYISTLTTFPFQITADVSSMVNQKPIGYNINISSANGTAYEDVNDLGDAITILDGASLYSVYYDVDHVQDNEVIVGDNTITLTNISAGKVNLQDGITYRATVTVVMDSGISVNDSKEFNVSWDAEVQMPNASISIDRDNFSAQIMPYAGSSDDILLSVYRRETDGTFTELYTDIQNGNHTVVIDPHPSLDYARYRIIAKSKSTGATTYNDLPEYPVGEKSIVIQWNEQWNSFMTTSSDDRLAYRPWNGSMIKIPYDISISDSYSPDVSLVEYIGRKRPVSYYGTQVRESSNWSVNIPKNDTATLHAIRRLAVWMGDVYVREPSGTGYWANITVSYSHNYKNSTTIPISFDIKRVEGGV